MLLLEIQLRDVVKVFAGVFAVGDGVALAPIRTSVGVDAACGDLVCADLRRLHELVVDTQRGNTFCAPQRVGAVHDILLCVGNVISRRRDLRL